VSRVGKSRGPPSEGPPSSRSREVTKRRRGNESGMGKGPLEGCPCIFAQGPPEFQVTPEDLMTID